MRMRSAAFVAVLFAALPVAAWGDVTTTPIITQQEVMEDFNAGKYPQCLQKIAMLLTGVVNRPSGAERAQLMALKGECLLQEKQGNTAAAAFTAAVAAYGKDKTGAAAASATATLIKKSPNYHYTPRFDTNKKPLKIEDRKPLPILDVAARPTAMMALFNDQLVDVLAGYKTLKASGSRASLPDIEDFATRVGELDALELTATGDDPQSADIQKDLATQSKTCIDTALNQMTSAVNGIATSAATMVNNPNQNQNNNNGGGGGGGGRRGRGGGGRGQQQNQQNQQQQQHEKGLTDSDRTTLENDQDTLEKFPPAIKSLITALSTDPDYYKTESENVSKLRDRISSVLAGHYAE